MFSIKKYNNFNATPETAVHILGIREKPIAAVCRYTKSNHSIFFLEEATFTYVVSGTKYMIVNNTEFFVSAGDLLYLPKNSIVFTYIPEQENGFESMNIRLSAVILKNAARGFKTRNAALFIKAHTLKKEKALEEIFSGLKKSIADVLLTDAEKNAIYTGCISQLICYLDAGEFTHPLKEPKTEDLETIKTALLESVYTPASVSAIARQCHMSTATFKRKFELAFGVPPKTWKRNICLQTAYFHLKTGNYKISDIVERIGFDSFSHFSYAFKKQFRFSPSAIAQNKLS